MKKTQRKLIPAVAMILVSAIMLSTSSFAWFSMNTEVKATGMKVQAKAQEIFLQISNTSNNYKGTTADLTATATTASKLDLKPVAIGSDATGTTLTKFAAANTAKSNAIKWYEATSADPTKADIATNYAVVATPETAHALKNTFYVKLKDAVSANQDLYVSALT